MSMSEPPADDRLDRETVAGRLIHLGHVLPVLPAPRHAYLPGTRAAGFVYVSGQTPKRDGELVLRGICGEGVTVEEASEAAELCAVNAIAALDAVAGLSTLQSVIKITVFVAGGSGFTEQAVVADAASVLLGQALGTRGWHARSAIGVASLPGGAPVELELIAYCPEQVQL